MSNDSDNILTIMTQQMRIDELETKWREDHNALAQKIWNLQQEKGNLRTENAGMITFIAAFELTLEDTYKQDTGIDWNIKLGVDDVICEALGDVLETWHELKAQHIGSAEQETE